MNRINDNVHDIQTNAYLQVKVVKTLDEHFHTWVSLTAMDLIAEADAFCLSSH